jgi:alginate O-acetyltransferase complex protein AlgI
MIFLDSWFWIFAAIAVPGFWLCPKPAKLYWLLVASGVFHFHFAGPAGMAPILLLALLTYVTGIAIAGGKGRRLFIATCTFVIGSLLFYKYSNFGIVSLGALATTLGIESLPGELDTWRAPIAPLAISFFTFEFVHYLYEVRVHGREPIRNPVHFGLFAIFFPSLASGPIKRFPDFVPQLEGLENPSVDKAMAGARRVIRGMFKKVCIADLLVEFIVVFEDVPEYTFPIVAGLAVLQGFRIYYDFAGYSDMAIGLAQMLNLTIPENFDRPYFSTSLSDFWRRWHMSLSSWIRDYIYIPLGGNRNHRAVNLLTAMFLCGLWHGAAWNFAIWGLYHGLGLGLENIVQNLRPTWFEDHPVRTGARWVACYGFVTYGWLFFFYPASTVWSMTIDPIVRMLNP